MTEKDDMNIGCFVIWTDINLSSSVDFLQDICNKHGNLQGEYANLQEIVDAIRQGQQYASKFRQYHNLVTYKKEKKMEPGYKTRPSELELRIRREVVQAMDEIMSYEFFNLDSTFTRARFIKDRLNLLWGEDK